MSSDVWYLFKLKKNSYGTWTYPCAYVPYEFNDKGQHCSVVYKSKTPAGTLRKHLNGNHRRWGDDVEKQKAEAVDGAARKMQKTLSSTCTAPSRYQCGSSEEVCFPPCYSD
eukprot:gb/GECG01009378.1/.p1 GENE.gb/GECG01009378.1/~~gb/GECG01009378.1/.p1  ORF type:complete len:111 (+),score=10.41 gb/GECG01009378.1/:1-333(+)